MSLSQSEMENIAALIKSKEAPQCPSRVEMRCEVTVLLPTFNNFRTLGDAIASVRWGKQSIPFNLLLVENGSSDGTQLVLRDLMQGSTTRAYWMEKYGFRDIQVVEVPQAQTYPAGTMRRDYNLRECYQAAMPLVKTPYVLFLDSDVECPTGGARTMLEALKADEKIGWAGITYDPSPGHVQHGLAMMATPLACECAKKLTMDAPRYPCTCSQFNKMVADAGLKSYALDPLSARHRRLEQ